MPGFVETIEFEEEGITGGVVDYLKGNIYQKVTATITVRFQTWVNCLTGEELIFADPKRPSTNNGWIRDAKLLRRFADFNVGDEIDISNSSTAANDGSYLIVEKPNDGEIRLTDTLGAYVTLALDLLENSSEIYLVQDPLGFVFDYGLIGNNEAFNTFSKVDGNNMRYEYAVPSGSTTIPASATSLTAIGKKDWQMGSVTVENLTTSAQRDSERLYRYEIVQELYIHPFYLHTQLLNFIATYPKAPFYFDFSECLKHVFRAEARREINDPNAIQFVEFDENDGNTGWYNEEYNGGTQQYEIRNLTYSNTVGALTRDDTVSIQFEIHELEGFQADYAGLNFILLPEQDSDYKNRNQLLQENYCWDRAFQTVGAGAINGERFGTGYEVFSNITVTNNTGFVTVDADVDFGSDVQAKIDTLADKRYAISVYTAETGADEATINYNTLLVDVNKIAIEIPDATVAVTNEILFHDQNDNTTVSNDHEIKVEDEIVIDSLLQLDRSSLDVQIEDINCEIIATDGTEVSVLETLKFDLSSANIIGGVRFIQQTIQDPFNVNSTEIRKEYKCYRSVSQDSGSVFAYRLQYPFLFRWEYWEQLILTGTLPADLYDVAQNFNGYNQDWIRLGSISGWDIKYRVRTNLAVSGTLSEKITDETLVEKDYLGNSGEWDNPVISSYDGATKIDYSGDAYIMRNKRTKLEMSWDYVGGSIPADETEVYMVARIIPVEGGTNIINDSFSSVWDREAVSLFTSNDGSTAGNGKIVITKNSNTFTGTVYVDHTKLPLGVTDYTISWSINRNTAVSRPDWGDVTTQNLKALEVIVPDPTIDLEENPFKLCCEPLKVLASTSDSDTYKNDFKGFIKAFSLQYTVSMTLEKYDPVLDSWSSVGALSNQVSRTKNNLTYYGHKVEWRDYLISDGEGKYRVNWDYGSGNIYSEEYCIYEYSQMAADETVRFEYTLNSVIGDDNQKATRDFVGMEWPDQLRVCDSVFYGKRGNFERESQRLDTGKELTVKKSYREEYTLEVRKAAIEVHDFLKYDVLMADDIKVCDYNSKNAEAFVDLEVEINSGYEPNYGGSRPYPSVELGFIDKYDQRRKLYS